MVNYLQSNLFRYNKFLIFNLFQSKSIDMNFLKIVIFAFLLLLMMNCSPYRSAFITNGNDASHRSYAHYESIKQQRTNNTVFLVNGKKVKFEKLEKYDDLTSVNIVKDKAEIERLGFDFSEVKAVVICERGEK